MKWQGFMLSEHTADIGRANYEAKKVTKPILDEYQIEEFESRINEAMEYNLPLKVSVWHHGFITEIILKVHYLNDIKKQIHAVDIDGEVHYISFDDIVGVEIHD